MLLEKILNELKTESCDPSYVFKKCHSPNSIVVLRKLETTKTTEGRDDVIDD